MSVELAPNTQLGFHRPLTQLVKRTLSVANHNSQPVAFKVKTTAPKQYCVRPNSGRIEPGEKVEVQVLLQPMKEDPPPGTKCRDKFLVQSAIITPDRETRPLQELWTLVEKEERESIHEQKIRCSYLPPVDAPEQEGANGIATAVVPTTATPLQNSKVESDAGDSKFNTVRSSMPASPQSNGAAPSAILGESKAVEGLNGSAIVADKSSSSLHPSEPAPAYEAEPRAAPVSDSKQRPVSTATSAATPSPSTPVSPTPAPAPASSVPAVAAAAVGGAGLSTLAARNGQPAHEEVATLRTQLEAAKKEIDSLKSEIKQKGEQLKSASAGSQQAVAVASGVPLQVVAGLVFGVFVFTWLFF